MSQIYALAIAAEQSFPQAGVDRRQKITAGWLYADSDADAHRAATAIGLNYFPLNEGWHGHIADVQPIIDPAERGPLTPMATRKKEKPMDTAIQLHPATLAPVVGPPPATSPTPAPTSGPQKGDLVRYVLTLGYPAGGSVRPAIVTSLGSASAEAVNCSVFVEFTDTADHRLLLQVPNAPHDPSHAPGTWHWPAEA